MPVLVGPPVRPRPGVYARDVCSSVRRDVRSPISCATYEVATRRVHRRNEKFNNAYSRKGESPFGTRHSVQQRNPGRGFAESALTRERSRPRKLVLLCEVCREAGVKRSTSRTEQSWNELQWRGENPCNTWTVYAGTNCSDGLDINGALVSPRAPGRLFHPGKQETALCWSWSRH